MIRRIMSFRKIGGKSLSITLYQGAFSNDLNTFEGTLGHLAQALPHYMELPSFRLSCCAQEEFHGRNVELHFHLAGQVST